MNMEMKVLAIRRAFGETKTATVAMAGNAARLLIAKGKIRIGWVMCRVIRCVEQPKCFKCQEIGHIAARCRGLDRSNQCFRCGEEGHHARNCNSNPRCYKCGVVGHRAGKTVAPCR